MKRAKWLLVLKRQRTVGEGTEGTRATHLDSVGHGREGERGCLGSAAKDGGTQEVKGPLFRTKKQGAALARFSRVFVTWGHAWNKTSCRGQPAAGEDGPRRGGV